MNINPSTLVKHLSDPEFKTEFQKDPNAAVKKAVARSTEHPLNTDKWIYRMVVMALGISLLIMVVFLSLQLGPTKAIEIPDVFISIISAIVGAISGLLAPSPVRNETPPSNP
jgi:hypothetical protein